MDMKLDLRPLTQTHREKQTWNNGWGLRLSQLPNLSKYNHHHTVVLASVDTVLEKKKTNL